MSLTVADHTLHEPMTARESPSFYGGQVTFICGICGASWDREATPENVAQANRHGRECREQEQKRRGCGHVGV